MIEQQIIQLVQQHGVLAVVIGALVEEIFVPLPSPLIPMAAGSIILEPYNTLETAALHALLVIALPASIASVLSSYFVYAVAYFGGEPMIKKYGKYLDLQWSEMERLERHFGTENEKYLVLSFRAIPIVPLSLVSGAAGLFRMNWKQYGIWSFYGMMPRNFFLAMIGWYFTDSIVALAGKLSTLSHLVAAISVLAVGGFIAYRNVKRLYRYILFEVA